MHFSSSFFIGNFIVRPTYKNHFFTGQFHSACGRQIDFRPKRNKYHVNTIFHKCVNVSSTEVGRSSWRFLNMLEIISSMGLVLPVCKYSTLNLCPMQKRGVLEAGEEVSAFDQDDFPRKKKRRRMVRFIDLYSFLFPFYIDSSSFCLSPSLPPLPSSFLPSLPPCWNRHSEFTKNITFERFDENILTMVDPTKSGCGLHDE